MLVLLLLFSRREELGFKGFLKVSIKKIRPTFISTKGNNTPGTIVHVKHFF